MNLAREHAEKVALHEARQQRVQRERQEAFEQQFKQDLSIYKESNNIPSKFYLGYCAHIVSFFAQYFYGSSGCTLESEVLKMCHFSTT